MAYFPMAGAGEGGNKVEILIDYDAASMAGVEITLSHAASAEGHTPETYTVTLDNTGEVEVDVRNLGLWVITWTHQGQSYREEVEFQWYGWYHVQLHEGFTWRQWVVAGGISIQKYSSLADLLANQEDIRRLCTIHAAVDYMCEFASVNNDLETIINTGLFAKWVNLRDYAFDNMEANSAIKDAMDEADLYGYGELIEDNGSYVPKGNVPVMTSNTAPYGEASASSVYSGSGFEAYRAFDNNDTTRWNTTNLTTTNSWIMYKFTNPVCVRKFRLRPHYASSTCFVKNYRIEASNDGSTWETLYTGLLENIENDVTVNITNDNYYLYYRLYVVDSYNSQAISVYTLQFYGRELKVSVPTMTSNSAPYGEASASTVLSGSGGEPYKAFDNSDSTKWSANTNTNEHITYEFTSKVKVEKVYIKADIYNNIVRLKNFEIRSSNDNTSYDTEYQGQIASAGTAVMLDLSNSHDAKYWRTYCIDKYGDSSTTISIDTLQFYGKDYSEKEFEPNTNRKWLYDHGVELEELKKVSDGTYEERSDCIYSKSSSATYSGEGPITENQINLSLYNTLRGVINWFKFNTGSYVLLGASSNAQGTTYVAQANFSAGNTNFPYNLGLDISSITQSAYIVFAATNGANTECEYTELWLE